MLTKQEIFDKVAAHLLAQGKRAVDHGDGSDGGVCRYRGDGGTKCAVGCLIPDELYDRGIEGYTISNVLTCGDRYGAILGETLAASGIPLHDHTTLCMLRDLQELHDGCTPKMWREGLQSVAEKYGVEYAY